MSIRYGQGFLPGGKNVNLMGQDIKKIKLTANANYNSNDVIINDEISKDKSFYFRSPINTPHSRIIRNLNKLIKITNAPKIAGIQPCKDGGSDHCNYITPTIHLGANNMSSTIYGKSSYFLAAQNYIGNLYSNMNTRGDVD